jgi:hypothetical protein
MAIEQSAAVMFSAAKAHLLAKIAATPVTQGPFPHLRIDEPFPPEFYAEMMRNLLPDAEYIRLVDTGRVSARYSPNRSCFMRDSRRTTPDAPQVKFWETFLATFADRECLDVWLKRFAPAIQLRLGTDLQDYVRDGDVRTTAEGFLMRDHDGYMLGPHIDAQHKAMTALFYLPRTDAQANLGTSLYRQRNTTSPQWGIHGSARDFDLIETVPYLPNRMLAFPNLPGAVHGVEPVAGAQGGRDLFIYDVKFVLQRRPQDAAPAPGASGVT